MIALVLGIFLLAQCAGPVGEIKARKGEPGENMGGDSPVFNARSGANPKLGSSLNRLLNAYHQGGIAGAHAFAERHMMVIENDRVQVTIVTTEETIDEVRSAVEAVGGEYQLHYKDLLQAMVPIGELESLANRSDIQIVREPVRAIAE
jgi:hypothetical protein